MSVSIRRARLDDVDFLVELVTHEDVEPFLAAVRPKDADSVRAEIERSQAEPDAYGVFVVEVDGERAFTYFVHAEALRERLQASG